MYPERGPRNYKTKIYPKRGPRNWHPVWKRLTKKKKCGIQRRHLYKLRVNICKIPNCFAFLFSPGNNKYKRLNIKEHKIVDTRSLKKDEAQSWES